MSDTALRHARDPRRPRRRPGHESPRRSDLSNDVLHVRRRRPRRAALRAPRVRQHLHAHHEPDERRARTAHRAARRRRRRARARQRPSRGRSIRSSTSRTPAITSSARASLYGGTYNAFVHTLPHFGIDGHARRPVASRRTSRRRSAPNTKAIFAETIGNPKVDVLDIEAVAGVARDAQDPADRRQHARHAVLAAALRMGRQHRRALGDEVHRRPRNVDRRPARRRRQLRLGGLRQVPGFHRARPVVSRRALHRVVRQSRVHHQGARAAAARPRRGALAVQLVAVPARPRNARDCAWSATRRTRSRSPSSSSSTRTSCGSRTRAARAPRARAREEVPAARAKARFSPSASKAARRRRRASSTRSSSSRCSRTSATRSRS